MIQKTINRVTQKNSLSTNQKSEKALNSTIHRLMIIILNQIRLCRDPVRYKHLLILLLLLLLLQTKMNKKTKNNHTTSDPVRNQSLIKSPKSKHEMHRNWSKFNNTKIKSSKPQPLDENPVTYNHKNTK